MLEFENFWLVMALGMVVRAYIPWARLTELLTPPALEGDLNPALDWLRLKAKAESSWCDWSPPKSSCEVPSSSHFSYCSINWASL